MLHSEYARMIGSRITTMNRICAEGKRPWAYDRMPPAAHDHATSTDARTCDGSGAASCILLIARASHM